MTKLKMTGSAAIVALLAMGACGGDDDTTTGADAAVTTADAKTSVDMEKLYALGSGTYKVTSFMAGTDGCKLISATDPFLNATFPLTVNNTTGVVSVGNNGSFGTGTISHNVGNLMTPEQSVTDSVTAACMYTEKVTSVLTMTGTEQFTLFVTDTQTNRAAACTMPAGTMCTSAWTMTMVKATPAVDAGAHD